MNLKSRLLWTFVTTTSILIYSACRKTDQTPEQKVELVKNSVIEERFFNSNRTSDPTEKTLVDFIKRKNSKEHFVEQTVKQIGYPRWDKIVTTESKSKIAGRGNSDSTFTTYYVPFVRDSQNFVNASMVIKAYPSDTTFYYKCDWQYAEKQNSNSQISDSAEYFAIFFMVLDQKVFGYNKFIIVDTNLFNNGINTPLYVTLDSMFTLERNNLLQPVEYCQSVTITFRVLCSAKSPAKIYSNRGNISFVCFGQIITNYCWVEYIEGGVPGGGSTTTPRNNPCGGTVAARGQLQIGCEPGWNPDPGSGTYYNPIVINGITYTTTDFPGHNYGYHWKWWENSSFLQPYGGIGFGTWAINYLSLNPTLDFSTFMNWFFLTPEYTGGEDNIDPNLITYDDPVTQTTLPWLSTFTTNFPKLGTPGNYSHMPSPQVYQLVGGSLYSNHLQGYSAYQNACALRGSRALLYSGITIPVIRHNGSQRTEKGSDNKNYILDAVSFEKFMKDKFGDTPHKLEGADANTPQKVADLLKGKNGIYVIINNNSGPSPNGAGYSGHVDLILNGNCLGGAYTTPTGGLKSIRVWVLN